VLLLGGEVDKKFYGIYRGICLDVKDPISKSRIRVKVPQILGEQVTDWAWPCLPASAYQTHLNHVVTIGSGGTPSHSHSATVTRASASDPRDTGSSQHTGHYKTPKLNDGVWVMFEGGDPNFPVWMGVF
jgi:hypothetical protein